MLRFIRRANCGRKDRPILSIHTTRLFGQLTGRETRSRNCYERTLSNWMSLLQVMTCCVTDESGGPTASKPDEASCTADELQGTDRCSSCNGQGRPVSRKTVLLMLKPELLERAMHGSHSFCSARDCSIVYFEDKGGQQFTVDDLQIRVGLKVNDDPIPLCYCFGFDENHIRDEIERTVTPAFPRKFQNWFERARVLARRATHQVCVVWE